MKNKNIKKYPIIEYIYIIQFAIQLFLLIGISENAAYRSFIASISFIITILLSIDIINFIYRNYNEDFKGNKYELFISKFALFLIPLLMSWGYSCLAKIVMYPNGLINSSQIVVIESIFIIISSIVFAIVIIWNTRVSGFFDKYWVSLILCCYLLLWFIFGLVFYSIDYNMVATYYPKFSFSESLLKEIQARNIISDNEYKLEGSQEDAVRAIFKDNENEIDYLPVQIDGKKVIVSNQKIGSNWAGYYYENLIKKYNAFDIRDIKEVKLNEDCLESRDVSYEKNYLEYFNKDYLLVTIKLFNSDEKNVFRNGTSECILFEKYYSDYKYRNAEQRDLYLIFEKSNFQNYIITKSKLSVNILKDCLAASNTFEDDSIVDFNMKARNGSSSVIDYLYYSAIVITTLGFGDITPIAIEIRLLTMLEVFLGLLIMGLFLAKAFDCISVVKKN